MSKRLRCWLCAIGALLLVAAALLLLPHRVTGSGNSARLVAASEGLDETAIEAVLSPDGETLSVSQSFRLQNRDGVSHDDVLLRLYPAAFASEETSPVYTDEYAAVCYPNGFSAGNASVTAMSAQGEAVSYAPLGGDATCIIARLPAPWQGGEELALELKYDITLPQSAGRFGWNSDILALGNAFAHVALWEDGAWRAEPYGPIGDPFYTACANYDVTLSVPEGYVVAATALPESTQTTSGVTTLRYQALAVRDFALSLSRRYQLRQAVEDDVVVSAFAKTAEDAGELLRCARQALRVYGKSYGAYVYPAFTVAEVDFPFGGVEYPGYSMIASIMLDEGGESLDWAVAHETAHQWWYAAIGSDPIYQPWQDEALCEFSTLGYFGQYYGEETRDELNQTRLQTAMRVSVPGKVTPGSPVSYFDTMEDYALVVYYRGAALFEALRTMNEEGLSRFLRAYYDRYAFSIATRKEFETLLHDEMDADVRPLVVDYLDTLIDN